MSTRRSWARAAAGGGLRSIMAATLCSLSWCNAQNLSNRAATSTTSSRSKVRRCTPGMGGMEIGSTLLAEIPLQHC